MTLTKEVEKEFTRISRVQWKNSVSLETRKPLAQMPICINLNLALKFSFFI